MAQRNGKTAATKPVKAMPAPANEQEELGLAALARGILAREIRPRIAQVRRLAEAILSTEDKRGRKKHGGRKKDGKKRKLAKIPGQKAKK